MRKLDSSEIINQELEKNNRFIVIGLLLFIGLCVMFGIAWYVRGKNFSGNTTAEMQWQNETIIWNEKVELTVENYFPFYSRSYSPRITKHVFLPNGEINYVNIINYEPDLKKENITINSYEFGIKFGEEEIKVPLKEISPKEFPCLVTPKMTVAKIIIDWNYNNTSPITLEYVEVQEFVSELEPYRPFSTGDYLLFTFFPSVFLEITPYLFFILAGFSFSWIVFKKERDIRDSYCYLICDFNLEEDKLSNELSNKLKTLQYFPKQIDFFRRIIFGLGILLFEVSINNSIQKIKEKCENLNKIALAKAFSIYTEESAVKLSDIIPGRQLIAVGLGFLTSIGISFSWNLGAAVPFIFVFGLFYFFFNLGSALFLMGKSKAHKKLIWILIGIGIFVILFPFIITLFRIF